MLTKKQLFIFEVFWKDIFKEYSYREIKETSKEKSNNSLQNALQRYLQENLINEKRIGNLIVYSLNLENEMVYNYFSLIVQLKLPKSVFDEVNLLKKEIEKYTLFYSLVIFGSYSQGKQKENSDLDIAIIIPDSSYEKNLKIALNSVNNKSFIKIDAHIITVNEFLEMLGVEDENLGKQIARKNLPIHNINIFYKLIKKDMKWTH